MGPVPQQQQVQHVQLTTAGQGGSQPHPNTLDTAQGSVNPNLGAFDQTRQPDNQSHDLVGQVHEATIPIHTVVDQNIYGFAQNDPHCNQTTDSALLCNQEVVLPVQTHPGTSDEFEGVRTNDGTEDTVIVLEDSDDFADQGDSAMGSTTKSQNQETIQQKKDDLKQAQERLLFPHRFSHEKQQQEDQSRQPVKQPAKQQKAVSREQAAQEQTSENDLNQQDSETDSLFGDAESDEWAEMLEPLASFNAEN